MFTTWIVGSRALNSPNSTLQGNTFESLLAGINDLQGRLHMQQKTYNEEIEYQRQAYEEQVQKQEDSIRELRASNVRLVDEITQLDRSNAALREEASFMKRQVEEMRTNLDLVQTNISTVKEAMGDMMRATSGLGPHIQVLERLDSEDSEREAAALRQRLIDQVEERFQDGAPAFSFVQLGQTLERTRSASRTDDLLSKLHDRMAQLQQEHAAEMFRLKVEFQSKFAKSQKEVESIIAEQRSLNRTKADLLSNSVELQHARGQLVQALNYLTVRNTALRNFFGELSKKDGKLRSPAEQQQRQQQRPGQAMFFRNFVQKRSVRRKAHGVHQQSASKRR